MTKLAAIAAVLALGLAPAALAQSQGQLEAQQAPVQRTAPDDTHGAGMDGYRGAEKGVGEQHGTPSGDRLAKPADPNYTPPPGQTKRMGTSDSGTASTNAKTQESLGEDRERPQTAEEPSNDPGENDRLLRVDPGDRTPVKRADDAAANPKPDSSK